MSGAFCVSISGKYCVILGFDLQSSRVVSRISLCKQWGGGVSGDSEGRYNSEVLNGRSAA